MICVDLFCGLGGWTDGFLKAGYDVIGVDIVQYAGYAGSFIKADIGQLDGRVLRGADVIVASPPCQEFSRHDMPWTRARNPPQPDLSLVKAAYRIRDEACPKTFILENVRAAQRWLGPAVLRRGPFYLWGDAVMLPATTHVKSRMGHHHGPAQRARIPLELSYGLAMALRGSL